MDAQPTAVEAARGSFQCEEVKDLWGEIMPLLEKHYREIAHYQDIALDVDREMYEKMDELGILRVYTARTKDWQLIGYAIFVVKPNLHYKQSKQAINDVIFLLPEYRMTRIGSQLIDYADGELQAEGVQVVAHHIKAAHDWSPILTRRGYELQDLIYTKRLDR